MARGIDPNIIAQQLFRGERADIAPTTGLPPQPQLRPEQAAIAQALQERQAPTRQFATPQGASLASELLNVSQDRLGNPIIRGLAGFLGTRELQKERERAGEEKRAVKQEKAAAAEAAAAQQEIENVRAERGLGLQERALEQKGELAQLAQQRKIASEKRAEDKAIQREERIEGRALGREKRKQVREATVTGFEFATDVIPTANDAKELKTATITGDNIRRSVNKLTNLVETSVTTFGEEAVAVKALQKDILVELNTIAKLGALSEGDLRILEGQAIDPTSATTRDSVILSAYANLLESVESKVKGIAKTRGFKAEDLTKLSDEELLSRRDE